MTTCKCNVTLCSNLPAVSLEIQDVLSRGGGVDMDDVAVGRSEQVSAMTEDTLSRGWNGREISHSLAPVSTVFTFINVT